MLVPTGSDHKENSLSPWTTTSTTHDSNNYDEAITFDTNNPYNSIATFCTQHQCLNPEEKKTFTAQLFEFFTECGYYDRECLIPVDFQHSFFEVYLLTLLQVIDSPDLEKQRLVALIEKASGMRSDTFPPKYLIFQTRSHSIDVWGWMAGSEGNRIQHSAGPPRVSKLEELDAHAPSRWFDPKQPFDSIQRFTRRCAALNQEDQKKTFGAITHFFRNRAYHGGRLALSDGSARHFAIIDLPFLLEWYAAGDRVHPDNEMLNFKKHQLIACVQQVTQKRFISIEEENQLQQILIEQNPLPLPSKQGFSWLKSDHLRSSQIPKKHLSFSNIESGYTNSDPLKAPFDPLIALALQKFQYPHVFNLDNSSISCLKSAILLLAWADHWKVTQLKNDITKWLKEANSQNSEWEGQAYISLLGQPEVCSALQNAGIGPFELKNQGANEETILQLLRYNMFWTGKGNLIAYSLGEEGKILNDAKLKALESIQKETLNENIIKEINNILYNDYNNRFKNLFPKEDKELEFLRKTIFGTPTIMRSEENSLDDNELTHYAENLTEQNLKNLFTFFQNAEVNTYFSIRKAAQTVRKPLVFLFFAQAEAFKASLQATQELSPQEISKMIEQADKLYDSPVKKVVGLFSCVVENNEALEALIKLGKKSSYISIMSYHMRLWRLTRNQSERALSLLENKEISFYLQKNNFEPEKVILLLKYFINESKIVELCQTFLNFLEENYSNFVAFPLLLEPIVGSMVDFAEGSTEINGILQRQETFLKALHKMPTLQSKLIDDGTAFIKEKENLYKPPHHLFKPKIHRQALIQIYTKLWLNDLLSSNFKDYNDKAEIEKFIHDSLLQISQKQFNQHQAVFPSKLTKEDAFKLSNLLVEPSVTEWAKHLPEDNPYCKESLLQLHFALQNYQSKSSSGSGWIGWFLGT
jgi:hypothetical protein